MSPSHFAHRFRAVARVSPMRYLRDVRLDAARTRLLGNGVRVSEVAIEVGFESPAHFTREFKRRFGVSPSKSLAGLAPPLTCHRDVSMSASGLRSRLETAP